MAIANKNVRNIMYQISATLLYYINLRGYNEQINVNAPGKFVITKFDSIFFNK